MVLVPVTEEKEFIELISQGQPALKSRLMGIMISRFTLRAGMHPAILPT